MARVIVPIPARDFDPTEVAVSWKVLARSGHHITFATPDGRPGEADDIMLTGQGLDPWAAAPFLRRLVLVGRLLRADAGARRDYVELRDDPGFRSPLLWEDASADAFDGLLLPGGHRGRGMREYLESTEVQGLAGGFFAAGKPVGAICHGVLVVARSTDPATGRSALYGRRTTALTWSLERAAWRVARRTRFWDPDYYRTYTEAPGQPAGYMSVQQEVTRALADPGDFLDVPTRAADRWRKTSGLVRDSVGDGRPAWVVRDENYVSARWPGDVHTFARTFSDVLVRAVSGTAARE